jgi:hypothetical protein
MHKKPRIDGDDDDQADVALAVALEAEEMERLDRYRPPPPSSSDRGRYRSYGRPAPRQVIMDDDGDWNDEPDVPAPRDFVTMRLSDDWIPPTSASIPVPPPPQRPTTETKSTAEPTPTPTAVPRRSALQLIEHMLSHPALDWLRHTTFAPNVVPAPPPKPRGLAAVHAASEAGKGGKTILPKPKPTSDSKQATAAAVAGPEPMRVDLLTTASLRAIPPVRKAAAALSTAGFREIDVRVVRGRPLELAEQLSKTNDADGDDNGDDDDGQNQPLLIVPCNDDAPGGRWMAAGSTNDDDETDLLTSSTCYPQLWPSRLSSVLPLKPDAALLLQNVLLFRTGEGARLRTDPASWTSMAALFTPFIARSEAENTPTNEGAMDRTRRLQDEERQRLGQSLDVSTAARRTREVVNAAATDVGAAFGSLSGMLAGMAANAVGRSASTTTSESDAESRIHAAKASAGKRLAEQLRFVIDAARHRGYRNLILPLGRWIRGGFSAMEVGQRLAQAVGLVEDGAFSVQSSSSLLLSSSSVSDKLAAAAAVIKPPPSEWPVRRPLLRLTVVCPAPAATFWIPAARRPGGGGEVRSCIRG